SSAKLWARPGFLVLELPLALLGCSSSWCFAGCRSLSPPYRWGTRCPDGQTLPRLALSQCVHERQRTMYAGRGAAQEDNIIRKPQISTIEREVLLHKRLSRDT